MTMETAILKWSMYLLQTTVLWDLYQCRLKRRHIFRENKADFDRDFHNAPTRQFIILLDGEIEITTSLGAVRRFRGGEILLEEDTIGAGHKTENIVQCIRKSLFITL